MMISDERYNNMLQANEAFRLKIVSARNVLKDIVVMSRPMKNASVFLAPDLLEKINKKAKNTLRALGGETQ